MLCADLIGFHFFEYARHFLVTCRRLLGLEFSFRRGGLLAIDFGGRSVFVRVGHVHIMYNNLQQALLDANCSAAAEAIRSAVTLTAPRPAAPAAAPPLVPSLPAAAAVSRAVLVSFENKTGRSDIIVAANSVPTAAAASRVPADVVALPVSVTAPAAPVTSVPAAAASSALLTSSSVVPSAVVFVSTADVAAFMVPAAAYVMATVAVCFCSCCCGCFFCLFWLCSSLTFPLARCSSCLVWSICCELLCLVACRSRHPGKFIFGSVDRCEPLAGLQLKIAAFERFLECYEYARVTTGSYPFLLAVLLAFSCCTALHLLGGLVFA